MRGVGWGDAKSCSSGKTQDSTVLVGVHPYVCGEVSPSIQHIVDHTLLMWPKPFVVVSIFCFLYNMCIFSGHMFLRRSMLVSSSGCAGPKAVFRGCTLLECSVMFFDIGFFFVPYELLVFWQIRSLVLRNVRKPLSPGSFVVKCMFESHEFRLSSMVCNLGTTQLTTNTWSKYRL